ncbi:MAG: ATP-binding protein [Actinobacteria bacterium]|nr:ATP-binding protein [Actinomycetota bacterium]
MIEVDIQASKTSFVSLSEGIHGDCQACGKWEQEGRTIRASLHLEPDPQSASRARRFVRTALEDSEPTETLDVLTLLTSEVVTNAILYGGPEIALVVERRETGIRVEVADAGPRLPLKRPLDVETTGGRGLRLLDSLAGGWGVTELASGKVVWFEIETHPKDPGTSPNGRVPPRLYL